MDPSQRALCFNNYFHSTFTDASLTLPPMSSLPAPSSFIDHVDLTEEEVYQGLIELYPTKAKGCDQLHPMILKLCVDSLMHPLHQLFTASLNNGILPTEWKIHKICPIPKAGIPSMWRIIVLFLSCVSLANYLRNWSTTRLLISLDPNSLSNNMVFLKTSLVYHSFYYHSISSMITLTRIFPVDVVYLDFKKAFDTVPHNELLLKLWKLGITGPLWSWFQAYLTGRYHYVTIDGASSPLLPVISGVPQGSILGPLLFLIYINDRLCNLLLICRRH